jgi:hypothetical protein
MSAGDREYGENTSFVMPISSVSRASTPNTMGTFRPDVSPVVRNP